MVTLKPSLGYYIQFNYISIDTVERKDSYLLDKRVNFLARYLNTMEFSFVCSLTQTLTKQKGIMIILGKISQSE